MTFQLDTSGAVTIPLGTPQPGNHKAFLVWPDLSPFVQGCLEAMFAGARRCIVCQGAGRTEAAEVLNGPRPGPIYRECGECSSTGICGPAYGKTFAFSDLAPSALARLLKDCEAYGRTYELPEWSEVAKRYGRNFWSSRANGAFIRDGFPPLLPFINDQGQVDLLDCTT